MESQVLLDNFGDARQIAVERALAEFRAARPVAIESGDAITLAFPAEGLTEVLMPFFQDTKRNARLTLPSEKVKSAGLCKGAAVTARLHPFTLAAIEHIAGYSHAHVAAGGAPAYTIAFEEPEEAEAAALALANLSLLLPAVMVTDVRPEDVQRLPLLSAGARDIFAFRDRGARSLKLIARTFVPLPDAGQCEFAVFRGGDGFRDQVAVIIGNPSPVRPVLTRIHSACLTGDLFGSLKCDCGDQLRGTVRAMAGRGGGIVLYLDQEGRGNGIANKIRAYSLQEEGFDTYDADKLLGFGQDQRRFDFAAEMLKQLGFSQVRLMTNNPHKIAALRDAGLEVVSSHRMLTRPTAYNVKYLAAKRDKGGHLLGDTALDGADFEDVLERAVPQG